VVQLPSDDVKGKIIGEENYNQLQRYVALRAVDQLWMEHLDTMDHLRDSVRLRGYGQRDPLVEYKREGHDMFQRLQKEIDMQISQTILRVTLRPQEQPVAPTQPTAPQHLWVTNRSDASGPATNPAPKTAAGETIGRNDPCPCGSGKKWKKCGMIGAPEHQSNMAKGGAQHQQRIGG
jgi:preprotein translocase subunit SecA